MSRIRTPVVIAICIAPSAAFSIGPQLAGLLKTGVSEVPFETAAFLVLQTAATVVMAWVSHEAGMTREWGKRLACLGLAVFLGVMQFGAALEVASHKRDSKSGSATVAINDSTAVQRELTVARNSRDRLPDPTPVTPAMVTAADEAVSAAEKSRKDECQKRGDKCREREADERTARADLLDLQKRLAVFERIAKLEAKLEKIGPAPKHSDGMAYRVSLMLKALGINASEQDVTEWWPTFQAFMIELIPVLGPYALAKKEEPREPRRWRLPTLRSRREETDIAVSVPAASAPPAAMVEYAKGVPELGSDTAKKPKTTVVKTTVSPTPATPAKSRKPKETKAATVTAVREWLDSRTVSRPGHDVPCGEAHKDYMTFSEGRGETAMSLTAFGIAMRDIEGVEKITTPSKRNFYRGIALSAKPALVAIK